MHSFQSFKREDKFSSDEQNQVWEGLKKQQPHYHAAIHGIVSEGEISALPGQETLHSCNFGSSHSPVKPLKANRTEGKNTAKHVKFIEMT